ncbi:MAG: protein kinase [Candidatus Obscuribacterales bacterium]
MQKLQNGTIIDDKYCVLDFLGIGGMGIVYKVEQLSLKAVRALKMIDTDKLSDDSWRRFKLEARAASTLEHANIIKVYDYGLFNKLTPYYVMEVVDGMTLGERININGPINAEQFFSVYIPVAQALAYIHNKGLLHRDIKPANIMLNEDASGKISQVKILDFGLVKMFCDADCGALTKAGDLTKAGEIIGSPTFMSPEQTAGYKLDQRSDIYSLGCAMFDALTGEPPYVDYNPVEVLIMHQSKAIPSLAEKAQGREFDERIELLVRVMLAKKPGDRHQKMEEVVQDLIAIQSGRKPIFACEYWQDTNNVKTVKKQLVDNDADVDVDVDEDADDSIDSIDTGRITKCKSSNQSLIKYATTIAIAIIAITALVATSAYLWQIRDSNREASTETKSSELGQNRSIEPSHKYAASPPYSHEATIAGKRVIVFDFPKDYSIGEISSLDGHNKFNAQGTVTMPQGEPFRFTASKDCMRNPQLLEQFKTNEIRVLELNARPGAKDEHIAAIKHLTKLAKLTICDCALSPAGIANLDNLTELRDLTINSSNIDDKAFSQLKILCQLEILEAREIPELNKTIKALSNSQRLQRLVLCNGSLDDQSLKSIGRLKQLTYLNLALNPAITSGGISALSTCSELKYLNLIQNPATTQVIPTLSALKKLSCLKLTALDWKAEDDNTLKGNLPKNCELQLLHIESNKASKDLDNLIN